MMKRFIVVLMIVAGIPFNGHSQDPEFTQFYANPIYLNPAFAGSHGCPRLNLNHRNQWPSISGAFVTN
ncbi:MAG: type IX secretion system membrane protein PorP/SprF, partial [Flavobacteriales bacterium]|nr:type IX secretion system membrane protein PorP/SprF [Flavobacteriales bacterium]